ncbi:MAG: GNAT family N-acetyltransferase [Acidobacteriota bacterium]
MPFSDLALSRRLERAEGYACAHFASARRRAFPESGSEWREFGGAFAVFDGVSSPATQTFGLGIFEKLTPAKLDAIEAFFLDRGAPVLHEVSPLAGVEALDLLCARHYRPVEICSVMYRPLSPQIPQPARAEITVRVIGPGEAHLWTSVTVQAWADKHPELLDSLLQTAAIASDREQSLCFLAEIDGQPGAAGVLCMHNGVALFGGSATIPALRRRGLQRALIEARLDYALASGCDLAMMVAEAGSDSQRNAERQGFHIAYTRTKWRLFQTLSPQPPTPEAADTTERMS